VSILYLLKTAQLCKILTVTVGDEREHSFLTKPQFTHHMQLMEWWYYFYYALPRSSDANAICLSVRPSSVCPSVKRVICDKTKE